METLTQVPGLPGMTHLRAVHWNYSPARLVEEAVRRGEATLTASGALNAFTGSRTGRSPRDKFMVDDPSTHDEIWWGKVNQPVSREQFHRMLEQVYTFLEGQELFVFDGYVGADPRYRLPIQVLNLHAWQNLFARQLFIRPSPGDHHSAPEFTVLHVPDFLADPVKDQLNSEVFVMVSIPDRTVLIGGTQYAGETKKSLFGVMNYLLPRRGVLPMHCSANIGARGDTALFFGLSGTGKTTLSADPERQLIGDDEHGWSDHGVFNFEGGCYAKCIRLSQEGEPQIWNAIRFGAVVENVVVDPETRIPNFDDDSVTENTRAAYPLDFIPGAVESGMGGHPENIIFLSYDATGVLPPVAKLTPEQAMYHFLSGYTSKTAGTEAGVGKEPQPEFSACFAHPFLPLPPGVYAAMLGQRLEKHRTACWLLNTGLSGGPYGVGKRMPLVVTRAVVRAILDGSLRDVAFRPEPFFGVLVPEQCPGVPASILNPRSTWQDRTAYDTAAYTLADAFHQNFAQFTGVSDRIINHGSPVAGR